MINWLVVLLSASITCVSTWLVGRRGGLAWWRRRKPIVQLFLLISLPLLVSLLMLPVVWVARGSLSTLASILIGVNLPLVLGLVACSYLVEQIRVAFSESNDYSNDTSGE